MGTLRSNQREPTPGHGPVKIELVQWRERSHGRGNSRRHPCGRSKDRRPTSDRDSPRRKTDMREPANKSLLTDVSGFCFHPCTIIPTHTSPQFLEKTLPHASNLDMGHKRMTSKPLRRNQSLTSPAAARGQNGRACRPVAPGDATHRPVGRFERVTALCALG